MKAFFCRSLLTLILLLLSLFLSFPMKQTNDEKVFVKHNVRLILMKIYYGVHSLVAS